MKANEALREVMKIKGVRPVELRRRIGVESNTLYGRFKQGNISIGKMNEMLRVMDYKVVIMPSDARVGEGSFEVE